MRDLNWANPYASSLSTWGDNLSYYQDAVNQLETAVELAQSISDDTLSMEYQLENAFQTTAIDKASGWRPLLVDDLVSAKTDFINKKKDAQSQYNYYLGLYNQYEEWLKQQAELAAQEEATE